MTTKQLPEAPASLNFKGVTKKGWDVMFTLRDADEKVLLLRFGEFIKQLEETYGITPHGNGKAPVSPNTPVPPPAGPVWNTPDGTESTPPPVQAARLEDNTSIMFDAESMSATTEAGKQPLWKVKGGKYKEWGVTIWPEILEEAELVNLDASQVYDLTGYTAYCEPNEKGNPKKVRHLAKE